MRKFTIHKAALALALIGVVALATTVYGEQTVNSLNSQVDDKATSYTIQKLGAGEVYDFMMKNPPRLVVDFIGAQNKLGKSEYKGDGRWIQKIRTSQFTRSGLGLVLHGHPYRKGAALTHLALDADRPAQQFRELLGDGQPQPRPLLHAALRPFSLTVFVEDGWQFVCGDALAGVRDRHDEVTVRKTDAFSR